MAPNERFFPTLSPVHQPVPSRALVLVPAVQPRATQPTTITPDITWHEAPGGNRTVVVRDDAGNVMFTMTAAAHEISDERARRVIDQAWAAFMLIRNTPPVRSVS